MYCCANWRILIATHTFGCELFEASELSVNFGKLAVYSVEVALVLGLSVESQIVEISEFFWAESAENSGCRLQSTTDFWSSQVTPPTCPELTHAGGSNRCSFKRM